VQIGGSLKFHLNEQCENSGGGLDHKAKCTGCNTIFIFYKDRENYVLTFEKFLTIVSS